MNNQAVIISDNYNRIDGRNAYNSRIKRITMAEPTLAENKRMKIAMQIWKENDNAELEMAYELPVHQVMDLMILLSRTLLHFQDAYRYPLLYDPKKPSIDRVGLQGGVMPVEVCVENENINEDIQKFSQSINDVGELMGERFRVLEKILEEMGY